MDKPTRPILKTKSPLRSSRPGVRGMGGLRPPPSANETKTVGRPPWYRRKYLVYPQFQMKLILLNSFVTLILFGFVAFFVVRSHLYLEALVKQTRIPAQNLFIQLMTEQLRGLLFYMVGLVAVGVTTTAVLTLLLSHKVAGPMIRLRSYFNNVSKSGEFPEPVQFRQKDFFQDLPPAINQAFTAIRKKWQR